MRLLLSTGFLLVSSPAWSAPPAQAAPAPREFDTVSVKPYLPQGIIAQACNSHSDPLMLTLVGCTLQDLVDLAYGLKSYQAPANGPAWIETDRYVIQARSTTPASGLDMMRMLQSVLAARFHLSVRWESRQAPVYLLEATSHGPKLQAASKTNHCGSVNVRQGTFQSDCLSMDDFAEALQEFVVKDHPVLNRTGIDKGGQYQFTLVYSSGDDPAAGRSLLSALPDQLGLRLKAGKAPVKTLVIDRVQRPQPN